MAGRAGAQMAVERKMFRSEFTERESSLRVSVIGRVAQFFPINRWSVGVLECWSIEFLITPFLHYSIGLLTQYHKPVSSPFKGGFDGINEPAPDPLADDQAIDHCFNHV